MFLLSVILISTNCFANVDIDFLLPNTVIKNACVYQKTGVYDNEFTMVPVYDDIVYKCMNGYYLPKNSELCTVCPVNSYCVGGEFLYSESQDAGIVACPEGTFAPMGMWESEQCGHMMHVGDDVLYLRASKKTEHALNFDVNSDGVPDFFANATTNEVVMNKNSERKFKVKLGDTVYYIYDDTVDVSDMHENDTESKIENNAEQEI